MCRLFGMTAGERRTHATFWLLEAPDSLSSQSHRNPDGTGLGTYPSTGSGDPSTGSGDPSTGSGDPSTGSGTDPRPLVEKQPMAAWDDTDFAAEARDRESTTFVAHVRMATAGGLTQENTHPFEMEGRLFAHNGGIGGLDRLERRLGDAMERVLGDTDSERVFALVTAEADRLGDLREGLVSALRWIAAELPVFALNIVLTTPDELYAVRYPETHELYLLPRAEEELDQRSRQGTRISGTDVPVVVVASEPLDNGAWELLAPGELVHVDRDLVVRRDVVLPDPPAHLVSAAELG